jgi:hypothetical protein
MFAAALALCLAAPDSALPDVEPQPSLCGVYAVTGTSGDDRYTGAALVTWREGVYHVQIVAVADVAGQRKLADPVLAVGKREGGRITTSWRQGDMHGLTVYTLDGATLRGRWTTVQGMTGDEVLIYKGRLPGEN